MFDRAVKDLAFSLLEAADLEVATSFPKVWPRILVGLLATGVVKPAERGREDGFIVDPSNTSEHTYLQVQITTVIVYSQKLFLVFRQGRVDQ